MLGDVNDVASLVSVEFRGKVPNSRYFRPFCSQPTQDVHTTKHLPCFPALFPPIVRWKTRPRARFSRLGYLSSNICASRVCFCTFCASVLRFAAAVSPAPKPSNPNFSLSFGLLGAVLRSLLSPYYKPEEHTKLPLSIVQGELDASERRPNE